MGSLMMLNTKQNWISSAFSDGYLKFIELVILVVKVFVEDLLLVDLLIQDILFITF